MTVRLTLLDRLGRAIKRRCFGIALYRTWQGQSAAELFCAAWPWSWNAPVGWRERLSKARACWSRLRQHRTAMRRRGLS
jgi:hypothetical protein